MQSNCSVSFNSDQDAESKSKLVIEILQSFLCLIYYGKQPVLKTRLDTFLKGHIQKNLFIQTYMENNRFSTIYGDKTPKSSFVGVRGPTKDVISPKSIIELSYVDSLA